MPSKLMKRAVKRESKVAKLAFDKTPGARLERINTTTNSQWKNRELTAKNHAKPLTATGKAHRATTVSFRHFQG